MLFRSRQSGLLEFKIGDVFTDAKILQAASEEAAGLLRQDPSLIKEEHRELRKRLAACRMTGDGSVSL